MSEKDSLDAGFTELVEIMARLRDPEKGCPWDLKQDFKTIAPYTLEEAYEVADAIERDELHDLCGELGDLLLQIVFHAQMASEQNLFDINAVCQGINTKMIRRHPHIFADESLATAEDVSSRWDEIKAQERGEVAEDTSHLHDVARTLPALKRAQKIQRRAAHAGFDWPDIEGVWEKLAEEQTELLLEYELEDQQRIEEEMGDLLFTCVNLSRHLKVDAEAALRRATQRFEERFRAMESRCEQAGQVFEELDTAEMEVLWQQSKKDE
ncbi:MAG: nucleoside triphosphate pyrophosphohydrolase [Gammaproteobacteria bacterium]|nr:nucleoside triphosphate pyrophosphohydrolase [Gammaproteobacteria bacterium]